MADSTQDWKPAPHDPIVEISERIWCVDGPLPRMALPRRMTVIRLASGALVIHSAICVDAQALARIEAWGAPTYLIVPNGFHRMDAPAWAARYPEIAVLCPRAVEGKVAKVVRVDGYMDEPPEALAGDLALDIEVLRGCGGREAVLIARGADDSDGDGGVGDGVSLIFNDAVFNVPEHLPGFGGWMMRVLGSSGGPRVTRIARWALVKDRPALAAHLRELAATPGLRRAIVSHGQIIGAGGDGADPAQVLADVADGLSPA